MKSRAFASVVSLFVVIGVLVFLRDLATKDMVRGLVFVTSSEDDGTSTTLVVPQETSERRTEDPETPATVVVETEPGDAPVTLSASRWPPGAAVRFRVVDATTLDPLPGFGLEISQYINDTPHSRGVTDDDGVFTTPAIFQRGTVDLQHDPHAQPLKYPDARELSERTFLIDIAEGETAEFEVRAKAASLVLLVKALRANGTPVFGRSVELVEGGPDENGELVYDHWRFDDTDTQGIARFLLYDDDVRARHFAIAMHGADSEEVWDTLYLDPPIHEGPWTLQLYYGGSASIRVLEADDRPVTGATVYPAIMHHRVRGAYTKPLATDAQGVAHFKSLPTGEFAVRVSDEKTGRVSTSGRFLLERGGHADVDIRLPVGQEKELAVSGTMLDIDGTPLDRGWLTYSIDGAKPEHIVTHQDGTFEVHALPGKEVVVDARTSVYSDPFEPERRVVPFGTTGLEFRRVEDLEEAYVVFRVLDATTGLPIADEADTAIAIYRAPAEGERVVASAMYGPDQGVTEVDFAPHPDLYWVVTALGYREQRGKLDVPAPDEETPILTIELARGFERELVVRNHVTGQTLSDAVIRSPEGQVMATTDVAGRATIEHTEWPEYVMIEREGYAVLRWEAAMHWFQFSNQAWMTPLR